MWRSVGRGTWSRKRWSRAALGVSLALAVSRAQGLEPAPVVRAPAGGLPGVLGQELEVVEMRLDDDQEWRLLDLGRPVKISRKAAGATAEAGAARSAPGS